MRIYILKQKGKGSQTLLATAKRKEFGNYSCYTIETFLRKKDAEEYLKTIRFQDDLEIVTSFVEENK